MSEISKSEKYDVIIIGAGAAGLMCAATAAFRGRKVLVLDHANKAAKKVLMSGGGRCNFTNLTVESENFICSNPHFCKSALNRYTQWDFITLVEKYQVEYYDKTSGQLFCTKSSRDIRDLLLAECQKSGARVQLKTAINKISVNADSTFTLQTIGNSYLCSSLVVATGGLSIPTMGASGFGYSIAQQFGHQLITTNAGLSPLTFNSKILNQFKALAGNSLIAEVSCEHNSFTGSILFTHKGLSGPAILQISSYWSKGKPLKINLLPDLDVLSWLQSNKQDRPDINLKTLLSTQFSQSISAFLVAQLNNVLFNGTSSESNIKLKQIEHKMINQIAGFLQNWVVYPDDLEGYRVAEVTTGGIATDEISSKTFESQRQRGLYFIGEVLDVTGQLGGFNFQWAWSSGHAAGEHV